MAKQFAARKLVSAGTMTGTTVITSDAVDISDVDNVAIMLVWTGTPNGTFAVQGSLDNGFPLEGGSPTWVAITLSPAPAATGSASSAMLDLNQLSFPWIRVVYTNTSSTGTLNVFIGGKAV